MGRIYHEAVLVIAASGAKDSSEGLFFRESPILATFDSGHASGSLDPERRRNAPLNAAFMLHEGNLRPSKGPLHQRAWTYQERLLAQRLVFFMKDKFALKCGQGVEDDIGSVFGWLDEDHKWHSILESYTLKSLTIETDRLHALRGIADHTKQKTGDYFYYEYGV